MFSTEDDAAAFLLVVAVPTIVVYVVVVRFWWWLSRNRRVLLLVVSITLGDAYGNIFLNVLDEILHHRFRRSSNPLPLRHQHRARGRDERDGRKEHRGNAVGRARHFYDEQRRGVFLWILLMRQQKTRQKRTVAWNEDDGLFAKRKVVFLDMRGNDYVVFSNNDNDAA